MNATPETWLPIPGYEGIYDVSDLGRVRSWHGGVSTPRLMTLVRKPDGHLQVGLRNGRQRTRLVHQLVLESFVGPRPPGMVTRHLNGDPADNRLANIVYGTETENARDTIRHGRKYTGAEKSHCIRGHEYTPANTYLHPKADGSGTFRNCRQCRREDGRKRRANPQVPVVQGVES